MKARLVAFFTMFVLASCSFASTVIQDVKVLDWSNMISMNYTQCEISFWNFIPNVDRNSDDSNYLYMNCEEIGLSLIPKGVHPTYQDRGISHDEIGISTQFYDEFIGCFVTSARIHLTQQGSSMVIECPGPKPSISKR